MGLTERDYNPPGLFPTIDPPSNSHLFLLPGEQMTWAHWGEALLNMHAVVWGFGVPGLGPDLDGVGFCFEIEVDGVGLVGRANFTEFRDLVGLEGG